MLTGYRVAPLGHVDIERAAADVRRAFDLDPLIPLPGWELFERIGRYHLRAGKQDVSLTYGVEEELPGGALACATYDETENTIALILSAQSYDALELRNATRARFSLAHEIGHAALHADRLIEITRVDRARRAMLRTDVSGTPIYRDSEWQANKFAGALLIPGPGLEHLELHGRLTPNELQKLYAVSYSCAKRRMSTFYKHRRDVLRGWR
jgi:hypothetical protein